MTNARMADLYTRLASIGFPRKYVRDVVLPEWWEDDVGESPAGFDECAILLARHMGADIHSIKSPDTITLKGLTEAKFKKTKRTATGNLSLACSMGLRAAMLAVAATDTEYRNPEDATEIRSDILQSGRIPNLGSLVDYCWDCGIPVLHLSNFPARSRKMDGMAVVVDKRPAIIICKNSRLSGWLLFILAHELGHICRRHVSDGVIVDESIGESDEDRDEHEADEFAIHLLNGDVRRSYRTQGRRPNASDLARLAIELGQREHVDPSHIVLNYTNSLGQSFYGLANAALRKIEPNANAPADINRRVHERLNWNALPEESSEFLVRLMGQ